MLNVQHNCGLDNSTMYFDCLLFLYYHIPFQFIIFISFLNHFQSILSCCDVLGSSYFLCLLVIPFLFSPDVPLVKEEKLSPRASPTPSSWQLSGYGQF